MRYIIEFCTKNLHHDNGDLFKKLEENPEYDVIEYGCLGNCGECYMMPFAYLNGELISEASSEELETSIERKIKETEALLDLLEE